MTGEQPQIQIVEYTAKHKLSTSETMNSLIFIRYKIHPNTTNTSATANIKMFITTKYIQTLNISTIVSIKNFISHKIHPRAMFKYHSTSATVSPSISKVKTMVFLKPSPFAWNPMQFYVVMSINYLIFNQMIANHNEMDVMHDISNN